MNKLLKLEWNKSSPFRKTTMTLMAIAFLFSLATSRIKSLADVNFVITLGMVFASLGLTFIGSLLYLKDDFDQKAPLNMIVPVNSSQIVMSKILVFMTNIIFVIFFGILLLYINLYLNGVLNTDFNYEYDGILSLLNINLKSTILFIVSFLLRLGELFFYSSLALLSILFIRSVQKKTGNIKWILLTIFIIFVIFMINEIVNQVAPISLDLSNLKIINLRSIAPNEEFSFINRFFILPSVCDQILIYASVSAEHSSNMIMLIPLALLVIFSFISVKLSMFLIDKKIDF